MANELAVNLPSISFTKSTITVNVTPSPNPLLVTVNGVHSVHDQLAMSTSDASITKGNIGTIGYIYVKNLDATNTIQIGSDGTTYHIILKPGEYGVFRWNAAAFHAKCTAGTPSLEYMFLED
jgi:hypothetical protein